MPEDILVQVVESLLEGMMPGAKVKVTKVVWIPREEE